MKSFIIKISIILLLSSNFSFAANFNWTKVATTDDNASEWYYDKKTVFQVGDHKYYWILTNYLKDIEDNIFSVVGHHMVNCKTNETRWISYAGYDRPMGRGNIVDTYIIPEIALEYFEWKYFDPKTTYGVLLKKVCNTR